MTHVNPENQSESTATAATAAGAGSSSGLPLRGLAMVLIAVAVLLVMWGLYAATQNNDSDGGQASPATTTEVVATQPEQPATTVGEAPEETGEAGETTAPETTDAPAPPAEEPARLNVINNSTVPNLAAEVADQLRGDYEVGEVGNLAEHILPENTVFFQPGNAEAEQRARELAERVGGVARTYEGFLPENTDGRNDLTLVLVNQVAL
ncbi:LytR C-terminal domain-containing protein [Corynebacterium sp.]|uniref:LytR C-terminal domain-containing protein n=1 Tax=Corynebacterium sp. TaxID=1720 RepID=UPI0026DFBB9A|nr:LytR C-terminal domain-containing protein [Corynebacterium sp.]MDO5511683.1 LytR C-terminal domain-containing protein [Corynebacterium sp.]